MTEEPSLREAFGLPPKKETECVSLLHSSDEEVCEVSGAEPVASSSSALVVPGSWGSTTPTQGRKYEIYQEKVRAHVLKKLYILETCVHFSWHYLPRKMACTLFAECFSFQTLLSSIDIPVVVPQVQVSDSYSMISSTCRLSACNPTERFEFLWKTEMTGTSSCGKKSPWRGDRVWDPKKMQVIILIDPIVADPIGQDNDNKWSTQRLGVCKRPAFLVQRIGPFSGNFRQFSGNFRIFVWALFRWFQAISGNLRQFHAILGNFGGPKPKKKKPVKKKGLRIAHLTEARVKSAPPSGGFWERGALPPWFHESARWAGASDTCSGSGSVHGRLIFIHHQCWEVLTFCRFQRQRCIKILCPKDPDFYTPLGLQTAKGQHIPALVVYKNQSPILAPVSTGEAKRVTTTTSAFISRSFRCHI